MFSPCNFDSATQATGEIVNDCESSCSGTACEQIASPDCDSTCGTQACSFSDGSCGYCAVGCTEEMLMNSEENPECNSLDCYYDSSMYKECSPGCTNSMLLNSSCDSPCNTSLCNFDFGSCSGVDLLSPGGCLTSYLGNGICNEECNTQEFSFDDYDCLCANECTQDKLDNDICDSECNSENCDYDNNNCPCPSKCATSSGDHVCDEDCWNQDCEFIDTDCGCGSNCKFEEITSCKKECLVDSCNFGDMGNRGKCTDSTKIKLARYYQYLNLDFSTSISIEECTSSSSDQQCTEELLRNIYENGVAADSTSPCYKLECAYCIGQCTNSCDSTCGTGTDCYLANTNNQIVCLACNYIDKVQFFTMCIDSCPFGYKDSNGICVPETDTSTSDSPYSYTIDLDNGSMYTSPFSSLSIVLARMYHKYAVIELKASTSYVLEKLEMNLDSYVPTFVTDERRPLFRQNYTPEKITIKSDTRGVKAEIVIASGSFSLFDIEEGELEFTDIKFETTTLISGCYLNTCTYCPTPSCSDCANTPDCSSFSYYNFISVYSNGSLVLTNVIFYNMRNDFESLININDGDLTMTNVIFDTVKVTDNMQSAVILSDSCTENNKNCGKITYNGGTVKNLNAGYTVYTSTETSYYRGFMFVSSMQSVSITNVNFENNLSSSSEMIKVSNVDSLAISNCNLTGNIFLSSFIELEISQTPTYSLKSGTNNTVAEIVDYSLSVSNSEVRNCIFGEGSFVSAEYSDFAGNIQISNIVMENVSFLGATAIEIESESSPTEGFAKTYFYSRRVLGYFSTPKIEIDNLSLANVNIADKGVVDIESANDVSLNEISLSNLFYGSLDLGELIGTYLRNTDSVLASGEPTSFETGSSYIMRITDVNNVQMAKLNVSDITIPNNRIDLRNSVSLEMTETTLDNCISDSTSAFFTLEQVDNVTITNSVFTNFNNTNTGAGVFSLTKLNQESALFDNCTFGQNEAYYASAIISSYPSIIIQNSLFFSNKGRGTAGGTVNLIVASLTSTDLIQITNCSFTDNIAINCGGAVYIAQSTVESANFELKIEDCSFNRETAEICGSAIYIGAEVNMSLQSKIRNSTFTACEGDYGVIYVEGEGHLLIEDCVFDQNEVDNCAGLQSLSIARIRIKDTNFTDNTGISVISLFGASNKKTLITENIIIRNASGHPVEVTFGDWTDTGSFIYQNSAEGEGKTGCVLESDSTGTLTGTIFQENSYDYGSGMYIISNSVLTCTSCEFIDNIADKGGAGISVEHSEIKLNACVFTGNQVTNSYGSAIMIKDAIGKTSTISHTQVYRNIDNQGYALTFLICNVVIDDLEYHDNTSTNNNSGVFVNMATLTVQNSEFYNQVAELGSSISATLSTLNVENSHFHDSNASSKGGAIFLMQSAGSVIGSVFNNLQASDGGAIYAQSNSQIEVSSSNFTNTQTERGAAIQSEDSTLTLSNLNMDTGTGRAVYCISCPSASVSQTNFSNFEASSGSGISFEDSLNISITNCRFENLVASAKGGALEFDGDIVESVTISGSTFINNTSPVGGAIYLELFDLNLSGNKFINNSAITDQTSFNSSLTKSEGIGGAVYLACEYDCDFAITSNTFTQNSATYDGGAIYWKDRKPTLSENSFSKNSAIYGPDIASFPIKLQAVDSNYSFITNQRVLTEAPSTSLSSVASGQLETEPMYLALVDHYEQIITTDSESIGTLDSDSTDITISGEISFQAQGGVFNVSGFSIIATPNSNINVKFTSASIDPDLSNSSGDTVSYYDEIDVNVYMRGCVVGEINSRNECIVCAEDFYSLDPTDTECRKCPDNKAVCYGANNIVPEAGYWRSSNTTTKFWACPNPQACIGSPTTDYSFTGECAEGYKGNMCQSCQFGYSRTAANTCAKCPGTETNVLKLIGILLLVAVVCVFMVKSALNSAYKPKAMHSVYLKIFINYLQLVMMTAAFNLDWPEYVLELFSVQENAGSATDQIFSIDCFLEDEEGGTENIFYTKVIFMSVLPLLIVMFSLFFWFCVCMHQRKYRYLKEELIATIIILIFLVHPNIIKIMFGAINCTEIDAGEYWLVQDLDINCWNSQHSFYAIAIAIPSILIWGIAIPAICLYILYKNKRKLHSLRVRKIYGFLFNGYSKREYYWEIVILYRKICILCCAVIIGTISIPIQALSVMLVIIVSLYLQNKYTPYVHNSLNEMEIRSILVAACTIYCGLFYLTGDLDEVSKLILFLVILFVNVYFLITWLKEMFNFGIQAIAKKIPCLRKVFVKQVNDGLSDSIFNLEEVTPHVVGKGVDKMYRIRAETQRCEESKAHIDGNITMRDIFLDVIHAEASQPGLLAELSLDEEANSNASLTL